MRIFPLAFTPFLALAAFAACGGNVETGTGGTGTTGTSSSTTGSSSTSTSTSSTSSSSSGTGGGSGFSHGCQSEADCNGAPCQALTPGGYKVCISFPPEVTSCMPGGADVCCSSADCAMAGGGACYAASDLQFCGGAFPAFNQCVADGCQSDADCAMGMFPAVCAPAGAFGMPGRACLPAFCHTDADCTAKPGGACVLVGNDPCCNNPSPDGLGCVYPGSCVTDTDCPNMGTCHLSLQTGQSSCGPASPGCPP